MRRDDSQIWTPDGRPGRETSKRIWHPGGLHITGGGVPEWRTEHHPDAERSPIPVCFTPDALEAMLTTVGSLPPETGGKGFGPPDRFGIDVFEFDQAGSAGASGAVYSPDVRWGEERRIHHLNLPDDHMRLWTCDAHSHPGGYGRLSRKSGEGLGDLGYIQAILKLNVAVKYWMAPVLTFEESGQVVIHPWVVDRDRSHEPMIAEFVVCQARDFPEREYDAAWLASLEEVSSGSEVEVVFEVMVPWDTPRQAEVMIRGSVPALGSWASPGLPLQRVRPGHYAGRACLPCGQPFEWKVTRGESWATVEKNHAGEDMGNRRDVAGAGATCIAMVESWADTDP